MLKSAKCSVPVLESNSEGTGFTGEMIASGLLTSKITYEVLQNSQQAMPRTVEPKLFSRPRTEYLP